MTMQTDDLIERLGEDLVPVRRLSPPWKRAALWLLAGGGYLAIMMLIAYTRHGALAISTDALYVIQQASVAATAVTAAFAAFASVIPGTSPRLRAVPLAPAAVMLTTVLVGCLHDRQAYGTLGLGRETDWPCVMSLPLGGALLWALGMMMLRRGAPLAPRASSALTGLAALGIANIEACVTRPHAFSITVVVWHGLTMMIVGAIFVRLGGQVPGWRMPGIHD
jgi:hypothetical protein